MHTIYGCLSKIEMAVIHASFSILGSALESCVTTPPMDGVLSALVSANQELHARVEGILEAEGVDSKLPLLSCF